MEFLNLFGVLVIPLGVWVWKIHSNDMKHLNLRLDKIEKLLQDHLQWHIDNKP